MQGELLTLIIKNEHPEQIREEKISNNFDNLNLVNILKPHRYLIFININKKRLNKKRNFFSASLGCREHTFLYHRNIKQHETTTTIIIKSTPITLSPYKEKIAKIKVSSEMVTTEIVYIEKVNKSNYLVVIITQQQTCQSIKLVSHIGNHVTKNII